jgi:polyvinyl alcohol dehydrogenase (cytochrome)
VRSAISVGRVGTRDIAVFGDAQANVYALDAATGRLLWKTDVDDFPVGRISGSPTLHNGRIYVGTASGEEASGANPAYECCKFRGSVVAVDAATGKMLWKTYTIEEPKPTKKNAVGTQLWGPSGAPVWSAPAIDAKLNRLYVTTGNNYSDPTSATSDSFIALDMDSGKILWSKQMTEKDAYTAACRLPDKTNCADSNGPDFDFSSSPMLISMPNGRRMLLRGQKSGIVHALDPDKGGECSGRRASAGRDDGRRAVGIGCGSVERLCGLSDIRTRHAELTATAPIADPKQGGGMFALRLEDGERVWYTPPPGCGTRQRCSPAQSAAVSAIPGVAFSRIGRWAHARLFHDQRLPSSGTSTPFAAYETAKAWQAVAVRSMVQGRRLAEGWSSSIRAIPPQVARPGNVLLAFSV